MIPFSASAGTGLFRLSSPGHVQSAVGGYREIGIEMMDVS